MAECKEELKSLLMKLKEESADEWIRKLWYIYTMEYYSAIKKNTLESVHCSMSFSNCFFLTCIQVLQEAGKVFWYSRLFKKIGDTKGLKLDVEKAEEPEITLPTSVGS